MGLIPRARGARRDRGRIDVLGEAQHAGERRPRRSSRQLGSAASPLWFRIFFYRRPPECASGSGSPAPRAARGPGAKAARSTRMQPQAERALIGGERASALGVSCRKIECWFGKMNLTRPSALQGRAAGAACSGSSRAWRSVSQSTSGIHRTAARADPRARDAAASRRAGLLLQGLSSDAGRSTSVTHVIDQCRRRHRGDEHLEIGRAVGRRRVRVQRGGNGGQVVVGRSSLRPDRDTDGRRS